MFLNVNIYSNILGIVLLFHCLLTCTYTYDLDEFYNTNGTGKLFRPGIDGCAVPVPPKGDSTKPKPSSLRGVKYFDYQVRNFYNIKTSDRLAYACDSGRILAVRNQTVSPKIIVRCGSNNELEFRRERYSYEDFTCEDFPDFDTIKVQSSSKTHMSRDPGAYDCFLPMPGMDYYMPIPFTNTSNPMIIHPNINGDLVIAKNTFFRLSCAGIGNDFVAPRHAKGLQELSVQCLNGSYIGYRNKILVLLDFRCATVPKPTIQLTTKTCNNRRHNVFEVGFQTLYNFLKVYRVCFDMVDKNSKFSWYFANTPVFPERQKVKRKLFYIKTKLYFDFEPRHAYLNQSTTLAKIIKSRAMANYYIKRDEARLLIPCHLMSKKEFIYAFEQWSTYYYENTVPQWYLYNVKAWKYLQLVLNKRLSQDYTRHLILTGTYNVTALGRYANAPRNQSYPVYLNLPRSLIVPLYIWKLDYDLDRKNGTVYIGFNNPYKTIDINVYFCNAMPCPTKRLAKKAFEKDLIFCCSKKDFERTYGLIDPVVYEDF